MSDPSEAPTRQRPGRALLWAPLFVLLAWVTWQAIANRLAAVEPGDGVADDIIKVFVALCTIVALEETFHAFIGRRWISVLLTAISVPLLVVLGYWLEYAFYVF